MKKFGKILWGLVFIIIGLIIAGNRLGIMNVNVFFDGWWTLFIIVPCFIGLFNDDERTGNLIGLFVGIILLLCCQNFLNFDMIWKLAFPTILILIGLSFIFKDTVGTKINKEIKKINENNKNTNSNEYYATFGGQDIKFENQEFKGTNLNAVFGGIKLDLRQALIPEDTVINCSAIFGGIDIFVPENVEIKTKSNSIFGGITNKALNTNKENVHTIYINATCAFGGVTIK